MAKYNINNIKPKFVIATAPKAYYKLKNTGGPVGPVGPEGPAGPQGPAATIEVGSTTTGEAGTNATVVNSGTSSAAVLDFTIPRGDKGDQGSQGETGPQGPAATITVGTVTTGAPGTDATVTNVGTSGAAVFDFTIPRGDKGESGSGTGDMLASDYDANSAVKNAGGIAAYVTSKVPTKTSDLENDSDFISATDDPQCEQGAFINIDNPNGSPAPLSSASLYGNTAQDGEPTPDSPIPVQVVTGEQMVKICGKNLFNYADRTFPFTAQGITASLADDGTVTITGVPTGDYVRISNANAVDITELLEDGATYTISASTITTDFYAEVTAARNTSGYDYYGTRGVASRTFTVDKSTHKTYKIGSMTYTRSSWGTASKTISQKFQLEKSSSATEWEAYQSQSYEVNLGKNLFDKSAIIDGNYINSSGTETANGGFSISEYISVEPNMVYAYSGSTNETNYGAKAAWYDGSKTWISSFGFGHSGTITAPASARYVRFSVRRTFGDAETFQLELGSTATDYAPYFTPIELCKLGTYQDYIYQSGDDWYVHKEVGKYTITGASPETWLRSGQTTSTIFVAALTNAGSIVPIPQAGDLLPKSDYFVASNTKSIGYMDPNTPSGGIMQYIAFGFDITSIPDIATAKSWFASNKPAIYYPLATPTDTQITNQVLIDQLEALASSTLFVGVNNIALVPSSGAQGELSLCFYQSTLPVATDKRLGAVIVGDGLNVSSTGVISTDPYYTKTESDAAFVPQTRTVNSKPLSSNVTLTASDVGALPDSTVIPTVNNATLTIQKNGTTVDTFTANASSNVTANITVPTQTSELANNGSSGSNQYMTNDLDFSSEVLIGKCGNEYIYKKIVKTAAGSAINTWATVGTISTTNLNYVLSIRGAVQGGGTSEYYMVPSRFTDHPFVYVTNGNIQEQHTSAYYNNKALYLEVVVSRSA